MHCWVTDDYWIGGTDEVLEGVWVWAATGKALSYTHWAPHQPRGPSTGIAENCIEMVQWDNHVGQWNDDDCTDREHFICEMEYVYTVC